MSIRFNNVLGEYLVSLDEKEYALFFELNADIMNRDIESWIHEMVASKRRTMEIEATIVEPTEEEIQDEIDAFLATSESINSLNNLFYTHNSEAPAEE